MRWSAHPCRPLGSRFPALNASDPPRLKTCLWLLARWGLLGPGSFFPAVYLTNCHLCICKPLLMAAPSPVSLFPRRRSNGADNTAPGCHVSPPASAAKLPSTPLRLQPYHARQAVAASILGASKMLERMPTGIEGTFTIYADAQNGNDANPGTSDKPVETVARGVELTRGAQAGQPRSLVLRTGYYSVTTTVEIGPQDSGLSIINDEGANAVVSGAAPLSVDWEPYKVGPDPIYPSGQRQWLYRDDTSAVGAAPKAGGAIVANGTTSTWQECEANCQATPTCNVWSFLGRSGKQCWFRTDDVYQPTQFYGDTSGYLTPPSPSLPPANIWRADLSPMVAAGLIPNPTALTVRVSSGRRGIRGRFPNADPETDGFASALEADSWGVPNTPVNPVIEYNPPFPFRNNSGQFSQYQLGIGGPCEHFNPPAGYWCGNHTSGGGAFTYRVPSGFVVDETILPHFPNYTNPTGAIVQTWRPGHWSSWAFQVDTFNLSTGQLNFSHGGFQGARGDDTGDNFYIAGVLEEVDTGAEYFYDAATSSLFLFHNSTGAPPSAKGSPQGSFPEVAIGGANSLFRIVGTKEVPVVNITISGLVLRDGGETLLNQSLHGMPSGGDWALTRNGVVYAEGTEGFGLFDCEFERNDGNDVMLFGYNLKPTVAANQFAWTGETCIALWGKTSGAPGGAMAEGMGPDGTAGEQPTNTLVAGNLAREFGVWEKQSSFFFQAKTGTTTLLRNIAFNGPRANVNFNDGFRGGNNLTSNLIFNSCRESGDRESPPGGSYQRLSCFEPKALAMCLLTQSDASVLALLGCGCTLLCRLCHRCVLCALRASPCNRRWPVQQLGSPGLRVDRCRRQRD